MSRVRAARRIAALALGAALLAAGCGRRETESAAPRDPGLSVWQFEGRWSRAGDGELELASLRGTPTFLLLFYSTCESICPVLVHDLQLVDEKLSPAARARVHFVLVTIDPEHDTVERLAEYARERQLDPERWFLLHGSADQVSELAAAVGVHYRPSGSGQFTHTIRILLLDRDGVEREHWDGLERPLDPIVRAATDEAERR